MISIRAENLAKQYSLAAGVAPLTGIRKRIYSFGSKLLGRKSVSSSNDEFWALRNVSFEIEQGEIVGVIGRNGAGKSTLLKVLSRITRPTSGRAVIQGRMASLLEVGTGFHPELTGRENIFLNGAILGMKRREIAQRFDEITAFSGVERFLDTPVKRYSSGMYVRLAFAVAANLDPDILLIDEVLAVGDAAFQKKCLNKMEAVQKSGRTVVFVSHSMSAVTRLCKRVILLENGLVAADGPATNVAKIYLQGSDGSPGFKVFLNQDTAPGDEVVRLRLLKLHSSNSEDNSVDIREETAITLEYDVLRVGFFFLPTLHFFNEEGVCAFITNPALEEGGVVQKEIGRYQSVLRIPGNFLAEGTYFVSIGLTTLEPDVTRIWERDLIAIQVVDSLDGGSVRGPYAGPYPGVVRPHLHWKTRAKSDDQDTFEEIRPIDCSLG